MLPFRRMDSRHLTEAQRQKLIAAVSRKLQYLHKLCARMQRLNFPEGDPLDEAAHRARDAIQMLMDEALRVKPH